MRLVAQARLGFHTPVLIAARDARAAGDFINGQAGAGDLVIASPALAWYRDTRVADFQQAVAFEGGKTEHLARNIPPGRLAYPAGFDDSCYVVTDRIWTNWAAQVMPAVQSALERVEHWPSSFEQGEFTVFANPEISAPRHRESEFTGCPSPWPSWDTSSGIPPPHVKSRLVHATLGSGRSGLKRKSETVDGSLTLFEASRLGPTWAGGANRGRTRMDGFRVPEAPGQT